MRALGMVGGSILLATVLAPAIQAQDTADVKRLSILTFSAPVQLPGVTLPAGTYRFQMADINNAAHVVRVLSEDGKQVMGTFSTIAASNPTRDLRDTDTLVMWAERPAGQPQAAREWYSPQRSIGEEFVYPKAQAVAIASANRASVAAEDSGKIVRVEGDTNTAAAAPGPEAAGTDRPATQLAQNQAPAPAPAPAPAQVPAAVGTSGQTATSGPAPAPAQAPAPQSSLPRTASPLGLFGLLSGLALAAALGVRHLRIRAAGD